MLELRGADYILHGVTIIGKHFMEEMALEKGFKRQGNKN